MEATYAEAGAPGAVTRWLASVRAPIFTAYTVVAAFTTYFAMYGFRKAFPVGKFAGSVALPYAGSLDHKTIFILAQVLGYCVSKFLGIKVVSEMKPAARARAIIACVGVAEAGLVLFGLLPAPISAIGMLVNGLPLGMVWGLVFGFLEGRRVSDFLGAGLCASFIVGSGFAKSVGQKVLGWGVTEAWMPAVTGLLFFPPLLLSVAMLAQLPPPTVEDERLRTKREPMAAAERRAFFEKYAPGLVALIAGYVVLTALRDFRDNFGKELWVALGHHEPAILTTAEIPVAAGAVIGSGLMMLVKDNRRALLATHVLMIAGAVLAGVSTFLYQSGTLGAAAWMILVGLGLYVGYVPFNCVLFDRLIAATGSVGTAGFLIYVADAFGYLGSTALLLYKSLGKPQLPWLPFFYGVGYLAAFACSITFALSAVYFGARTRTRTEEAATVPA
jgi:hypothetical protein